jgi:DNA-binding HxlR family transcriptional regulator
VDILGDAWTPLVLRDAFYGTRRFEEFQSGLGIARNTLAERLRRLVDEGLMRKELYQTEPHRYEYLLTDKGRDFFSVLVAMSQWGDRWLAGNDGPPVTYHHKSCGHDTQGHLVCTDCGEPLHADNTLMRMGPGYPKKLRSRPDVQKRFAATG